MTTIQYPTATWSHDSPRIEQGTASALTIDCVERPPSLGRKIVELMFYISFANSSFISLTGIGSVAFAGGGAVVVFGLIAFAIIAFQGERQPMSFWFMVIINIAATVTGVSLGEMPVVGEGMKELTQWLANSVMVFYLVRNEATSRRVLFFLSIILIVSVVLGGVRTGGRLDVEEVGSAFSNANRLAYSCGMFVVGLLFWSLRGSKLFRPILWFLAAVLIYYLFSTVSRGGILAWVCGMAVLCAAVLLGRGVRLSGIVLVFVALLVSSQLATMLTDSSHALEERAHERSTRLDVYSLGTLGDLARTTVVGRGSGKGYQTAAGIESHNSFLYTHMVFGGITAWPYLIWLIILSVRLKRMVLANDFPLDIRLQPLALFGMGLASQLLSNQGYLFISTVYATAVVEKYTAMYSRRRIMERELGYMPEPYSGYST